MGTRFFGHSRGLHLILRNACPLLGFYENDTYADGVLIVKDRWTHLGFVYDFEAREQRIFVDGDLVAIGKDKPPLEGNAEVTVGTWAFGGRFLNGAMLRLLVWREALSTERLKERYADRLEVAGPSETLAVAWSWDETSLLDTATGTRREVDYEIIEVNPGDL